jgi:ribulose-5-phosphate 4-epimerase/fuculose-1-phosphate aldolase
MLKNFQQLTIRIVDLVNSPRKTQRIIRNATVQRAILKDFCEALRSMNERGFLVGSLSEVSQRANGGRILITPSNIPISRITEESVLTIAINRGENENSLNLPKHIDWHRSIYKTSNANSVILCQPVYACIVGKKMQVPNKNVLADAADLLKEVEVIKGGNINNKIESKEEGALLISSVGVLAWGKDINSVMLQIEAIEKICEIEIISALHE